MCVCMCMYVCMYVCVCVCERGCIDMWAVGCIVAELQVDFYL